MAYSSLIGQLKYQPWHVSIWDVVIISPKGQYRIKKRYNNHLIFKYIDWINTRECRRHNQKWTIQTTQGTQNEENQNINKTKTQHNMCWTPLKQSSKHKQHRIWALLQPTGGQDEVNTATMWKSQRTSQHGTRNVKYIDCISSIVQNNTFWSNSLFKLIALFPLTEIRFLLKRDMLWTFYAAWEFLWSEVWFR